MNYRPRFILFAAVLASLVCTPVVTAAEIRIAVASNFLEPAREVAGLFERASGDVVKISAGSTGKLYAQIINGAPYDIFLAANESEPAKLVQSGHAVAASRFTYATGKLALWSPKKDLFTGDDTLEISPSAMRRVSMANPRTAPYGLAADAVINKLFSGHPPFQIIRGENISQAYAYVRSGNTDAGFVALSQIMSDQVADKGSVWRIPDNLYDPIRQQAVLLSRSRDNSVAQAFLEFLRGQQIVAMLSTKYGYGADANNTALVTP